MLIFFFRNGCILGNELTIVLFFLSPLILELAAKEMNSSQVNPTTSNKPASSAQTGNGTKLSTLIKIFKPWKWKSKGSINKKKFDKNGSTKGECIATSLERRFRFARNPFHLSPLDA